MKAAFFDFDNTLTIGDTLPLWLAALRGWPWTIAAYAAAATVGACVPAQGAADTRGRIKATLLRLTVRGIDHAQAAAAGERIKGRVKWRQDMLDKLREHHAEGHRIVVVTGAATIYLPALLEGLPVDEVLGTELERARGRLTGRIAGINCVRDAKAETVEWWLNAHQPEETWGYGNAPHDLKMLELLDHRRVVA